MASFIRFFAAVACLLTGGVVGALNPQPIALDLGFAALHTSLGLGVLVALLLGVLAGGLLVAVRRGCAIAPAVAPRGSRARTGNGTRELIVDFLNQWIWFVLFLPLAALLRLGHRPARRRTAQRQPGQQAVHHLFPRPELPAQRAAGQGDRAVPAHRRTGQGHLRDPGRARPSVPPAWRSRSRDPPAPGAGAAPGPDRPAEDPGPARRWARTTCVSGLLDRAETVFNDLAAARPARAAGAAAPDRHLPGRARLGEGDRATRPVSRR